MILEGKLLRGERVILRPFEHGFTEEELYRMYRWSRDESVLRWSGGSVLLMSFEEFKDALYHELHHPDKHSRTFSLLTDTGEFIGRLGFYNIDYRRHQAELGIAIGEKAYWGLGYGTDAVKTLLAYIFRETDLQRIYLHTYAANRRAQRAFEKCGFRKVKRNRRFSPEYGAHDEIQMEIYRSDWLAQQGGNGAGPRIEGDRE